jgi:hypothetical protein
MYTRCALTIVYFFMIVLCMHINIYILIYHHLVLNFMRPCQGKTCKNIQNPRNRSSVGPGRRFDAKSIFGSYRFALDRELVQMRRLEGAKLSGKQRWGLAMILQKDDLPLR